MTRLISLVLLTLSFTDVSAQNQGNILLSDYLLQLEKSHDLRFTYADETIEGIQIPPLPDSLELQVLVQVLENKTGLNFKIINERFISISKMGGTQQAICGFLLDGIDGLPIERAAISVGNRFTISDSTGFFRIAVAKPDSSLVIRRAGYLTNEQTLSNNKLGECLQISMTPDIVQLEEITVVKLLTQGIIREPDGVINMDVRNLGILPGLTEPDVLLSIQALPGIQSVNETVSDINIRGGTNDQNLVLWDGIRMYQTGHFFGLISAFNPYLNKDVRIIKNGSSAFYGDGVSSTIDIRSDDHLATHTTGGGGLNMINADIYLKIPITRKVTLQIAGRRSMTDVLKTPVFKNYFERVFRNTDVTQYSTTGSDTTFNSNEQFYFYDVTGNLLIDLGPNDKLRLHGIHIFNDLNYKENIVATGVSDSKTSSLRQQSLAGGIDYQRTWDKYLVSRLQFFVSTYLLNGVNFNIPNNQRVNQQNEVIDSGIKFDTRWLLGNQWDILMGYQFFETGVANLEEVNNPEFYRYIKQVIRSHVLFVDVNYTPSTGTSLRVGLRGNYYGKFNKLLPEPRLAFRQDIGQNFAIEVLGEFKNQTATQVIDLQNDFLGVEKRRWVLANEQDIPIVQSKQASAGVIFERSGLLISLEGYYKKVTGITSASQGFQNQFQYLRSSGNYSVFGTEFLINEQLDDLSIWAGYTYTDNLYDFAELTPPSFPNNLDIHHTISAGVIWQLGNLETSAGINWHSGKPYTLATGVTTGDIQYDAPNAARLPNYFRADLSIRYTFNISDRVHGQVGGAIWNLTNHSNIFNIYYQAEANDTLQKIEQVALGITPNVSLRVSF